MAVFFAEWAPLALRLVLGVLFMAHGYPKLYHEYDATAKFLKKLGFPLSFFWAGILGITEFFGGFSLIIGFATRVAALLLTISMTVAAYVVIRKLKKPFKGGYEFDLLILACLIALLLLGAGNISVDAYIGWILG